MRLPLYQPKDTSVVISDAVAGKLSQVAADFYRATTNVLVITDGYRTPADMARILAHLIVQHSPNGNLRVGMNWVKGHYRNGDPIRQTLAVFDPDRPASESVPAMTAVITHLVDDWIAGGRTGRPPLSYHLDNRAVDVRATGMTRTDQTALGIAAARVGAVFLDETSGEEPHIHLTFL